MSSDNIPTQPESALPQDGLHQAFNIQHLKQKRARSQLSCIPCRSGKLKCSRAQDPACDQCIKRNRQGQCQYLPPATKQKTTQNVKGRIRQLETLVVDLMYQQSGKVRREGAGVEQSQQSAHWAAAEDSTQRRTGTYDEPTPPSDSEAFFSNGASLGQSVTNEDGVNGATKPFGWMRINKDEISYVGDTHWQAILSSISELRRDLVEEPRGQDTGISEQAEADGVAADASGAISETAWTTQFPNIATSAGVGDSDLGLLLDTPPAVTRERLIASIPEKRNVDRLLSLWFNSPDPIKSMLHGPTFQDEYRRFWRDPKRTPTMWLGMLFAIMSLAASFRLRDVDPTSQMAQSVLAEVNKYHSLSASAAILADYSRPKQYTMECLILYAAGLRGDEKWMNVWLTTGLIIRIGLRMGYHRDPSSYPAISPFQGEMRRRTWALVTMIDVLFSFQLGLPPMVKHLQSDTQPPRNLLDRDFNVSTKVLPADRSIDELTPSSYTKAKICLVKVFADAIDTSHVTSSASHESTMKLDGRLEDAKAQFPPQLQMPDFSELVTDRAEQLMCRFNLDLLYLKTKIVIHRRYISKPFVQLTSEEQKIGVGTSRKACVTAALQVLKHHHTIYQAIQPGGQLESVKWYMHSISTHDFLLAAMVICLELSQQLSNDYVSVNPLGKMCPHRGPMIDALENSRKIWSETTSDRKKRASHRNVNEHVQKIDPIAQETEKASRVMEVMLEKIKARFPQQADSSRRTDDTRSMPAAAYTENGLQVAASLNPFDMPAQTFDGRVAYNQSAGMNAVPNDNNLDGSMATSSSSEMTSSTSNDFFDYNQSQFSDVPNQPRRDVPAVNAPDFAMFGDMLELPGNIDWETFDSGVNIGANQQPSADWNAQMDGFLPRLSATTIRPSLPVAGNVFMNGGSGPGSGRTIYPGGLMSFPDLEDVDYSMTDFDFGASGWVM